MCYFYTNHYRGKMSVSEAILAEKNLKCNSFLLFTFCNHLKNIDFEYDRKTLENYIYRESSPNKINIFENLLWDSKFYDSYTNDNLFKKVISHYFYNNDFQDILNLISNDFNNLKERYLNYKLFLFHKYELLTERKFFINLKLFMEKQIQNNNNDNKLLIISLVKLWCIINIDKKTLREKFIPSAFSIWYENNLFYKDYFYNIANDDIKNEFYEIFLESIISDNNNNDIINIVNDNVEITLRKYTLKLFYFFA